MIEINLNLVIEVDPYDYLPLDNEAIDENIYIRFNDFLKNTGVSRFRKLENGFNLFYIGSIDEKGLDLIIENHLIDVDFTEYRDQIAALPGGVVISINGISVITPNCCGDLSSIYEWKRILTVNTEDWNQIWIGHPWIFYRIIENRIEFSNYYESNIGDIEELYSSRSGLRKMI